MPSPSSFNNVFNVQLIEIKTLDYNVSVDFSPVTDFLFHHSSLTTASAYLIHTSMDIIKPISIQKVEF